MRGEIGRRRDGQHACLRQFARDQSTRGRITETDGEIKSVGNQVAGAIAHHQLDAELGVSGEKTGQMIGKYRAREEGVDIDAQSATHRNACPGHVQRRLLNPFDQRPDLLVEAPPLVG